MIISVLVYIGAFFICYIIWILIFICYSILGFDVGINGEEYYMSKRTTSKSQEKRIIHQKRKQPGDNSLKFLIFIVLLILLGLLLVPTAKADTESCVTQSNGGKDTTQFCTVYNDDGTYKGDTQTNNTSNDN